MQVRSGHDTVNWAVGAWLSAGCATFVVEFVPLAESVTVRVTDFAPALAYLWVVVIPVSVLPSPKSHE